MAKYTGCPDCGANLDYGESCDCWKTRKEHKVETPSASDGNRRPLRIGTLDGLSKGQANRIYSVKGKSICLQSNAGGGGAKTGLYKIDLPDGDYLVRKLTPVEAERCQTLPDGAAYGTTRGASGRKRQTSRRRRGKAKG